MATSGCSSREYDDDGVDLVFSRECVTPGMQDALYRRHAAGELVRVSTGAYAARAQWEALTPQGQHRVRVHAGARLSAAEAVFSHYSAAAMWGLPLVGPWPDRAHVVVPRAGGGRSNRSIIRHAIGVPDHCAAIDGVCVTGLPQTVVDMACILPFAPSIVMADAALRMAHDGCGTLLSARSDLAPQLDAEVHRVPLTRGGVKARRVIDFADARSDSPGESLSRANMMLGGVSAPELQAEIRGASGRRWVVDFWWPEFGVIGEFDGRAKYRDPRYMNDRTAVQVVIDEKERHDDLQETGRRVTRWYWETATSPARLRAHLARVGVR